MQKYNFIKTLTTGVALAVALCPQARAADTGSCGENCVYNYDPATQTITYTGTGPNGSGIINIPDVDYNLSGPTKNVIVSEGITDILRGDGSTINYGAGTGKLVLPSTLQNIGYAAVYGLNFKEIEINSTQLSIAEAAFRLDSNADTTVIMSADANITFDPEAFYFTNMFPKTLTIACKGNPDDCLAKFGSSLARMDQSKITADYYREYDANNNLILEYTDTGYIRYDESGRILGEYSLSDNLLASYDYAADGSVYTYDANGKLTGAKKTSPFTPAEAAALIKKGNVNKVTLTFK